MKLDLLTFFDLLIEWENLETKRLLAKATFLYKVLTNTAAPTLKDSLIRKSTLQSNYNLRNSQTDLSLPKSNREFFKKAINTAVLLFGIVYHSEVKQAQSTYLF